MLALLLGIEVITLFLGIKSFGNKNNTLDDIKLLDSKSDNLFAIMVKDSSGNYNESSTFPTGAYILNETMSSCVDNNGNKIDNVLSYESGHVYTRTNKTVYCYLYFDKDNSVYAKVLDDYENNKGVKKTTDENGKDVYYYAGNVTNNNLLFNNYCWKMVRTTETDGVKLLYNGLYSDSTKCNNTGTSVYIDSNKTAFNTNYNSPAYVGYMYGTVYAWTSKLASSFGTYYYGSDVTWNGTTYTLSNAESGAIADMYSKLSNKHYTCLSTSSSCSTVYYIYYMGSATSKAYYMTLTNGKKIDDALDEMLNYNTTNSNIKTVIDNWYKNNMTNATNYLENAIYCNNRYITNLSASGWNPSGGSLTTYLQFNDYSNYRLTCQDKEDQFTLKVDKGGTIGYGNSALDYPVGLLTIKEANLAFGGSSTNYLNNGDYYWLLSPNNFYDSYAYVRNVYNGNLSNFYVNYTYGARPAVSLSTKVKLSGEGNGTIESPYILAPLD